MKNLLLLLFTVFFMVSVVSAQTQRDSITFDPQKQLNAAQSILSGNFGKKVTLGGYSEIIIIIDFSFVFI